MSGDRIQCTGLKDWLLTGAWKVRLCHRNTGWILGADAGDGSLENFSSGCSHFLAKEKIKATREDGDKVKMSENKNERAG